MKINSFCLAVLASIPQAVLAQDKAVELGEIDIVDTVVEAEKPTATDAIYESYDPVDTGVSVINQQTIENSNGGGIDTTELLQTLPFIQMDVNKDKVTNEDIQSIRPSDFSISGGNYYDNNIMIDGVGANSIHDVTSNRYDSVDYVAGQTSQTLYIDPSLLGNLEVLDSNVSAEYGDFVGGVVKYDVRQPKDEFAMKLSAGYQSDSMVNYKIDNGTLKAGEVLEKPPEFEKYTTSVSFDLPVSEQLRILTSYTQAESTVIYTADESYGGRKYPNADKSQNYLVKAVYDYSEDLILEGQVLYSPYESEREQKNRYKNFTTHDSNGLQTYLSAKGFSGETEWSSKLSMMQNDSSRKSPDTLYRWKGSVKNDDSEKRYLFDWCYSSNCYEGGYGDLEQKQTDYTWNFKASTPFMSGDVNYGFEWKTIVAEKNRLNDYTSYSSSKVPDVTDEFDWKWEWNCSPVDPSCKPYNAATSYTHYAAYDSKVTLNSQALWTEYFKEIGSWSTRLGVRYSHDDFLDNHNLSPRITTAWEFMDETYLTLGANRYYSRNMVSYALYSKNPDYVTYKRRLDTSENGQNVRDVPEWDNGTIRTRSKFGESTLDTPYSDEFTAALTIPTVLTGNLRLKTVLRKNKDQFASSAELCARKATNGRGIDCRHEMTNDGKSDYMGYAIEWSGSYKNHFFNANVTWSETSNNGHVDYFDQIDPSEAEEKVWYDGRLITMEEFYKIQGRQNFAAPFRASVSWSGNWLNNRLLTHAVVHYRGAYKSLKKTGDEENVDGTDYDVYGIVKRKDFTTVDLNTKYLFIDHTDYQATVELKVKNLFDKLPHTDTQSKQRYQKGRSYWIGLTYTM